MPYPDVDPQPDFPALELEILDGWQRDRTFERSVAQRDAGANGDNEFVFYDGPPFANGLPHYGHLLTGFVKDAVPRFQTMRGRRVERRFGWDCHGYPVESEAEKVLDVKGRAAIVEHGIGPDALAAYDEKLCDDISAVVLRNREAGPFGILNIVDERCGSVFDDIDDVMSREEMEDFMARYKSAAGYAIETLNAAPPTIARGASVHE